jgi:hypothetical protein
MSILLFNFQDLKLSTRDIITILKDTLNTTSSPLPILDPYATGVPSNILERHSICHNPNLAKCEETHTPKVGDLESFGTPECLKLDSKGQNTSPWGVLGVIEKVLKCRCLKWPRIGHLDICSPSYGQKKG